MVEWHHWLNGHEFEQALRRWWRTGKPGVLQSMILQRVGYIWAKPLITLFLLDYFPSSSLNSKLLRGRYLNLSCSSLIPQNLAHDLRLLRSLQVEKRNWKLGVKFICTFSRIERDAREHLAFPLFFQMRKMSSSIGMNTQVYWIMEIRRQCSSQMILLTFCHVAYRIMAG